MPDMVEIFEVGPRDGLQNEPRMIATDQKIALIDLLSGAGFQRIEVASFVSPRLLPQMADAAQVLAGLNRVPGVAYAALTPNLKGFERALAAGADEVAIFGAASEGFSRANINASIAQSLERFAPVAQAAAKAGVPVRGYVSCAIACPFDGPTPVAQVARVAAALRDLGCYQISLGDTIGAGTPQSVRAMLNAVLQELPADQLAGHFHDTGGRALANIEASLDLGLRVFDAAVGGLGGCPFAGNAPGNVATETVVNWLHNRGFVTGLDPEAIGQAAALARGLRGSAGTR
ncbi:hydroxymethylglutaryl-CoA lyase [Actibacterium atlanticum]|uniref:hydroxymethylglutaryl-CoA lyase n=1 Tax=Actibacterium atlanticum TaxID=1461693 RepID=UPI00054EBB61|nr:hydroxymethylglutaryl-CoA lyase [Actibacterium atlanticum]